MITGSDEWAPILDEDEERTHIAVLYSVDPPSSGQSPCDQIAIYEDLGISFHVITLGSSANGVNCPGVDETIVNSNEEFSAEISKLFATTQCELYTVDTPFNGGYVRTNDLLNGFSRYEHRAPYSAYYDAGWTFSSPNGVFMAQIQGSTLSTGTYPQVNQLYFPTFTVVSREVSKNLFFSPNIF